MLGGLPLILWSCSAYYHTTNSVIPYVEEKGDIQIEPNYGESESFQQFGVQGAYMLDSMSLFTGSIKCSPDNFKPKTSGFLRRSSLVEMGYGLRFKNKIGTFNYYPVFKLGVGSIHNKDGVDWNGFKYIRPSLQNTLLFRSSWVDMGVGIGIGAINFVDIKESGLNEIQGLKSQRELDNLKVRPFVFYSELSPYVRIGLGDFKVFSSITFLGFLGDQEKLEYEDLYANFGFSFIINKNRVN